MLSVIMPNVVMLSVVALSVVIIGMPLLVYYFPNLIFEGKA